MNTSLKTIALATLVAGAIALSGCTATSTDTTPTPAPTSTSTAAPTETPAPAAPVVDAATGDAIDAQSAEQLNAAARSKADDRAYQLPDSTWVFLRAGDPLPEPVLAAASAAAVAQSAGINDTTNSDTQGAGITRMLAEAEAQAAATGKSFAVVTHLMSRDGATQSWQPAWGVNQGNSEPFATLAEATAYAQAWVDKSPETRAILVVDTLG